MKKLILILLLLLLLPLLSYTQEHIGIGIYQDARLLVAGDAHSNKSGTINLLARIEMQGKQQTYGYLIIFPEFEYAEIEGNYKRWSVNVGYCYNGIDRVKTNLSVSYGWIDRGISTDSFGINAELSYAIGNIDLSLVSQYNERSDLGWLYGKKEWRFSGFVGLKYNIGL